MWAMSAGARSVQEDSGRPLTENEKTEAMKVYGDKIKDYYAVRVYSRKWTFFQGENVAMAPNGNIYWPGASHCADLTACTLTIDGNSISTLPTFIHEMGHVMQHQNGMNVILRAGFHQALHYASFTLYDPYIHGWNDFYSIPSPNGLNPEAQADWYMYNYLQNR